MTGIESLTAVSPAIRSPSADPYGLRSGTKAALQAGLDMQRQRLETEVKIAELARYFPQNDRTDIYNRLGRAIKSYDGLLSQLNSIDQDGMAVRTQKSDMKSKIATALDYSSVGELYVSHAEYQARNSLLNTVRVFQADI